VDTQEQGLTGYSLSLCISDILRGSVKEAEVAKIVAGTKAPTRDEFLGLIESYGSSYWHSDPERGKEIALRFYDSGKIDQPRTRGEMFTNLAQGGIWRRPETPEVKTLDENAPGITVAGLVGGNVVEEARNARIAEAVKGLKEGAPCTFKVAKPLKLTPRA
jgi:hypothetical protein